MKNTVGTGDDALWAIGDRITGNDELESKIVLVSGVSGTTLNVDTSITLANSEHVRFIPPRHYRFPAANIANLRPGMRVKPSENGGNSIIGAYKRTLTVPAYVEDDCGFKTVNKSLPIANEPAINPTGPATFNSYGEITAQAGDIIFETPIGAEFTAASYNFQAYGTSLIESITNSSGIKITNLKVNDGEEFYAETTVDDASATGSASLSDFDVASKNGIMDDVSTVSGINITSSAADPTVTTIASSTGKNITVTPGGHYLENGQTITFNGATQRVEITGDIEISDVGTASRILYLDLDKFLTIASNA